jgi:hypothetical protein
MYSYEERLRAVKLYLKLGKRCKATINQLGYPTKNALKAWHNQFERRGDLQAGYARSRPKYSDEQRNVAVEHWANHGRFAPIHVVEVCSLCGGSVRVMPKALAALAGQALACIEDQDVMPDTHKEGHAVKPGRPSTGSWITCARKNRKHRLGHCWCHRPERHLGQGELMRSIKRGCPGVRCLFSLGRIPAQQHYTSKEASEYRMA